MMPIEHGKVDHVDERRNVSYVAPCSQPSALSRSAGTPFRLQQHYYSNGVPPRHVARKGHRGNCPQTAFLPPTNLFNNSDDFLRLKPLYTSATCCAATSNKHALFPRYNKILVGNHVGHVIQATPLLGITHRPQIALAKNYLPTKFQVRTLRF